jgi:transposase
MVRRDRSSSDRARKLAAVRAAARHSFPTADIDEMLAEIGRGYSAR